MQVSPETKTALKVIAALGCTFAETGLGILAALLIIDKVPGADDTNVAAPLALFLPLAGMGAGAATGYKAVAFLDKFLTTPPESDIEKGLVSGSGS